MRTGIGLTSLPSHHHGKFSVCSNRRSLSAAACILVVFLHAPITLALNLSDVVSGKRGFVVKGSNPTGHLGASVTRVGDVNGDGLDDVMMSTNVYQPIPATKENRCYIVFGKASMTSINQSDLDLGIGGFPILVPPGYVDKLSIAGIGDLNGDGLADLAIGSLAASPGGRISAGQVFVVFGKQGSSSIQLADVAAGIGGYVINGAAAYDLIGETVSGLGDTNGDGLPDLLITARATPEGAQTFVVFGKLGTAPIDLADVASGSGGYRILKVIVYADAAGDVNGDGLADIVVDTRKDTIPLEYYLQAVIFGKTDTATVDALAVTNGVGGFGIKGSYALNGFGAKSAGDVNGDGLGDLISQIWYFGIDSGFVSNCEIIFGKKTTSRVVLSDVDSGRGGFPVKIGPAQLYNFKMSTVGDINGDGLDDVAMGLNIDIRNFRGLPGIASVIYGKTDGLSVTEPSIFSGSSGFAINSASSLSYRFAASPSLLGESWSYPSSISAAGDVNGDGIPDYAIGIPGESPNGIEEAGNVYVVFGGRPAFVDSDGDGIADIAETNTGVLARPWNTGTDPYRADSDGDEVNDGRELRLGTDPNNRKVSPAPQPPQFVVTEDSVKSLVRGAVINGMNISDAAGYCTSTAGDVNGDGIDDVLVGAPTTQSYAGSVYVIFGAQSARSVNLSDVASGLGGFVIRDDETYAMSGIRVSGAGDVNGDGLEDIEILSYKNVGYYTYVVFGKHDTAPVSLSTIRAGAGGGFVIPADSSVAFSVPRYQTFQSNIKCNKDINGDGLSDIVVSIVMSADEDMAFVVFGKPDPAPVNLSELFPSGSGFAINFDNYPGFSARPIGVKFLGDINGDGLGDLGFGAGRDVYVVFGKPDTSGVNLSDISLGVGGFKFSDNRFWDTDICPGGDVNGDGIGDIVLSTPISAQDITYSGQTYVVFGKRDISTINLNDIESGRGGFIIKGSTEYDSLIPQVAGDVNGDGLSDIVITGWRELPAPAYDPLGIDLPHAHAVNNVIKKLLYVVYGKTDTRPVELYGVRRGSGGFVVTGWEGENNFALNGGVAAGDFNRDGLDDLIVGAPGAWRNSNNAFSYSGPGHAYVIYGFRPVPPDSDGDGVPDYAETGTGIFVNSENTGTDRLKADSDGDSVNDGTEITLGTDPGDQLDFPELPLLKAWLIAIILAMYGARAVHTRRRSSDS